jgi:hypothetical protein
VRREALSLANDDQGVRAVGRMTFECTKWTRTRQTRDARHVPTVDYLAPVHRAGAARTPNLDLPEDPARALRSAYTRLGWYVLRIRLGLGWLAGWPSDGSYAAHARLVRQLPIVAFRPRSVGELPCGH